MLTRAVGDGRLRRLGRGIYTADLISDPAALVARNRWEILRHLVPDAIVADRSAAADGLPVDGTLFVISNERAREVVLPGLTIAPRTGKAPLVDDLPWAAGLHITSEARTLVDNLAVSRRRGGRPARTLDRSEVEDWLVRKAQLRPEGWLAGLRERASEIARELEVPERRSILEDIIGSVAGTRPVRVGAGSLLTAHAAGRDWDPARIERLEGLADYLDAIPSSDDVPDALPPPPGDLDGSLPFFEAYFSNFIEGTEFTIEEAEAIVETGDIPASRPEDAHDILGTYRIVSDPVGRAATPSDPGQLFEILRARHSAVMSGRPEKRPGVFKEQPNQAGSYTFVAPDLVEGTLIEGWRRGEALAPGFARAIFQLFLVSEVHPFDDGNGRIARASMCAELSAVEQARILVPIVHRNEYMGALRLLSREGRCDVLIRVMAQAWRWTASMPWDDRPATLGRMASTNALLDSTDAERSDLRLELP